MKFITRVQATHGIGNVRFLILFVESDLICNLFPTAGNGTVPRIELDSHFPRTQQEYVSSMIKKRSNIKTFAQLFFGKK